jgi:hypothetical protein
MAKTSGDSAASPAQLGVPIVASIPPPSSGPDPFEPLLPQAIRLAHTVSTDATATTAS